MLNPSTADGLVDDPTIRRCDRYHFATHAEAIHGVSTWIETIYNRRRRHSGLGQISPVAFEQQLITTAAQAA